MTVVLRALVIGAALSLASVAATAADNPYTKQPQQQAPKAAAPAKPAAEPAKPAAGGAAGSAAEVETGKAPARAPAVPSPKAMPPEIAGECAWTGKRIVSLLARDDVEQSKRFLEFYRMFGCKEEHLGPTMRCVIMDATGPEAEDLTARVDRCWAQVD